MSEDVTEPNVPALNYQPRAVLNPVDYADELDGRNHNNKAFRLNPTRDHSYLDGDDPVTDPIEDLIRRGMS